MALLAAVGNNVIREAGNLMLIRLLIKILKIILSLLLILSGISIPKVITDNPGKATATGSNQVLTSDSDEISMDNSKLQRD
ncbi:MAG: hypothetical protein GX213_08850 [Clostridiaceae bacterium]|nr:hypothetical protein [Clostridiaceae bacterium]